MLTFKMSVLLDLKTTFTTIESVFFHRYLLLKDMTEKLISFFWSLCASSLGRVRAYCNLSVELITRNGARRWTIRFRIMWVMFVSAAQLDSKYFSTVWAIEQVCFGWVFDLEDVTWCCRIVLTQSRTLFLQEMSWVVSSLSAVGRVWSEISSGT